jgi:hypothetical protein
LKRTAQARQRIDGGLKDLPCDLFTKRSRGNGSRSVGTHSAGVGTGISVPHPLVILCRNHRHDGLPVGKRHDGQFFPVEKLLDQHPLSCLAEDGLLHRIAHRLLGVLARGGHDHPLALRQPVGLHHDRHRLRIQVGQRLIHLLETSRDCGRNPVGGHDLLRKAFARLQPRSSFGRTEDFQTRLPELIGNPKRERRFRTDYREIDLLL